MDGGDLVPGGGAGSVYPVLPSISNIGHGLSILQSCPPPNLMLPLHYTQLQTFDQTQPISIPVGNIVQHLPQSIPPVSSASYLVPHLQQQPQPPEQPTTKHNGDQNESSEEEDVHLCGGCKKQFTSYTMFKSHKKSCPARKSKSKVGESNPVLEATAISLLANQFSQSEGETSNIGIVRNDTDNSIPIWTQPPLENNSVDTIDEGMEETESGMALGSPDNGSLICLTMDTGQGQDNNCEPLHTSLVTIPQISSDQTGGPTTSTSTNLQIQECLNFSLSDTGHLQFDNQGLILHSPEDRLEQKKIHKEDAAAVSVLSPTKKSNKKDSSGRKVNQCTFVGCLFTTKYSKDLVRHMTMHTGEKPYSCSVCFKSFGRQDKLTRHMQIHSGYKPFHCAACDYKAPDKSTLKKHMRVHTDERPYHCQICPYKSKDSSQLTVHLRTHTGDAPFACQHKGCSATFKTNSDLTRHKRTHTGEMPYKCDYCDHRVKIKSNLKAHIRVNHRPNEVFKCKSETCSFVTVSKAELKNHIKTHENFPQSETLKCNYCSFSTNNGQKLTIHLKEHEKTRPHKCNYCAYSAKTQAILSCHVNKRHSQEVNTMKEKEAKQKKIKDKAKDKVTLVKTICKPNFNCPVCNAGFVRRDSLRSHIRQHKDHGVAIPPMDNNYNGSSSTIPRAVTVVKSK